MQHNYAYYSIQFFSVMKNNIGQQVRNNLNIKTSTEVQSFAFGIAQTSHHEPNVTLPSSSHCCERRFLTICST